jgi:hypothetical protein
MSELKGLKVKDAVANKVLTTDENGVMQSSDIDTNNIATLDVTNDLAERVTNLEGDVVELHSKIVDINGEEV